MATCSGIRLPHGSIERLTGIVARRYADPGVVSSDLACEAGAAALADAGIEPEDVEVLIFASASHDVAEPATANIVQAKLGARSAHVLDVKNACNSFLNGLDIAQAMITTSRAERVLVTTGEVVSPFIDWKLESEGELRLKLAAFTLGDAGGACVVTKAGERAELRPGRFFSDGSHWTLSTILAGGSLMGTDMSRVYFECDSVALQALAYEHIPDVIAGACEDNAWSVDEVHLVVPHQVSRRIITRICRRTGIPVERMMITLDRLGNTAAASIPVALSIAAQEGRMARGDKVLLVGGAAGFSASVVPLVA